MILKYSLIVNIFDLIKVCYIFSLFFLHTRLYCSPSGYNVQEQIKENYKHWKNAVQSEAKNNL